MDEFKKRILEQPYPLNKLPTEIYRVILKNRIAWEMNRNTSWGFYGDELSQDGWDIYTHNNGGHDDYPSLHRKQY